MSRRGSSPLSSAGTARSSDGGSAEALEAEAEALERGRHSREQVGLARARARAAAGRAAPATAAGSASSSRLEALEEHALVRHVLVDEEDLVVARRHDEGVLELADHRAEAHGAERRGVSSRNRAACGDRPLEAGGRATRRPRARPSRRRASRRRRAAAGPPGGEARLGLDDAARAERLLHRGEERLLHEARRAEAHPGLGRMDVDVDLAARQLDAERGDRELVARRGAAGRRRSGPG